MSTQHKSEAYEALRREIDSITERMDEGHVEYLESSDSAFDYIDGTDRDEVIARFRENYSSGRIGFQPFDHLDGNELADALLTKLSAQELSDLVLRHCTAKCRDDIYIHWNDMVTVSLGETEHQIDIADFEGLAELIAACTAKEQAELLGRHCRPGYFFVCGRPCEILAFKLDAETFLKAVEPILRAAGLTDPDDTATEAEGSV